FFMCATTFAQVEKELSVQLPHTSSSFAPLSAAPKQVIINIKEDGSTVVAGKTYDPLALGELLASMAKRDANVSVILRADERTIMKYFASVASLCRNSGVEQARVSYIDDGPQAAVHQ